MLDPNQIRPWLDLATSLATLVALLIGLVQLRDLRRSIELTSNLAVMQAERQVWSAALANPEIAPDLMRERWGENPTETLFAATLLDHFEGLYFQYQRGAIAPAKWRGLERAMLEHMASPAIRRVWEAYRERYWAQFVRHVDRALERQAAQGKARLDATPI